jgi:hypothetical protein
MAQVISYNRKYVEPRLGLKDATKQLMRALYGPSAKMFLTDIPNTTAAQFKTGIVVRIPKGTQRYVGRGDTASENELVVCGNQLHSMAQHGLAKGIKITYTEA